MYILKNCLQNVGKRDNCKKNILPLMLKKQRRTFKISCFSVFFSVENAFRLNVLIISNMFEFSINLFALFQPFNYFYNELLMVSNLR
jgi:hypothetical protein